MQIYAELINPKVGEDTDKIFDKISFIYRLLIRNVFYIEIHLAQKTGFLLKRINSFIIFTFPSITNVVRRCALQLLMSKQKTLDKQTLKEALQKETQKM